MSRRDLRLLLPALALVLALQLGSSCGALPAPLAKVRAEAARVIAIGGSYAVKVEIVVSADHPFQAYDLELQWNPDVVVPVVGTMIPHPDFDDDGALFAPIQLDPQQGRLRGIVDLRHGGPGVSGEVSVASVWFYAAAGGQAVIRADGDVVAGDGGPFTVAAARPLTYPASH